LVSGCSLATRAGVALLYREAELPPSQIVRDLCYAPSSSAAAPCDSPRHLLDLYTPAGSGWPVIVFVHGGGWNSGDKNYKAGGADVYANIGRFYAGQGIGVAVINYRLQPAVAWAAQVDDVRAAVTWVRSNIGRHGGSADRIFLMGHSAGAHLTSLAALSSDIGVRGVIAVSGAALDLADERTYQVGADRKYYEHRFKGDGRDGWQKRASPALLVSASSPPFLVLYATGEDDVFRRQSQVLHDALTRVGARSTLLTVEGESHTRMVLALSRGDKAAAPAILQFVQRPDDLASETTGRESP